MNYIRILALVLCACFVSAAWGQQPPAKGQNNWSEFHRTNMMRWNPYEKVLSVNNVGSMVAKWSYAIGTDYYSSPAVANGAVYVGSTDDNVYALNAHTGAKLWSYTTGDIVFSSPAVVNGVVYVGSDDKSVYALSASTGAKLWSYTTGWGVESSPTVSHGVVYIGSEDGSVYALKASTGAKLWSYALGGQVGTSSAVANGMLYIGTGYPDYKLYAFGLKKGRK